MCLHPEELPPIPDETVRVAKAAFPKGNLYMRLGDELGVFYKDEDFASLYLQPGQQEEKGQGAGSKGKNRDGACTPPLSSALEGRGLYPCSASLRDATRTLHALGKGLLPLLPAPFPPASSGQPAQAPWRLAMILMMQYLENLSDKQATLAVQGRIERRCFCAFGGCRP